MVTSKVLDGFFEAGFKEDKVNSYTSIAGKSKGKAEKLGIFFLSLTRRHNKIFFSSFYINSRIYFRHGSRS
jgi:hypothetical protein